jgi:lipopolysaccharide export system protein LptA
MTDRKRAALTLAGGLAVLALPGLAQAQLSPDGGPVNASADHQRMETDKATNYDTIYLDGRVEIFQNGRRLRCDHAKIIEAPRAGGQGGKDVVQMEAIGNVYYVAEDQTARGDYGIYTKADDTLKVTGNVILERGYEPGLRRQLGQSRPGARGHVYRQVGHGHSGARRQALSFVELSSSGAISRPSTEPHA